MKSIYRKLVERFDALNVRERWLVSVAVLGGIVLLGHSLFIAPAQMRARLGRAESERTTRRSSWH